MICRVPRVDLDIEGKIPNANNHLQIKKLSFKLHSIFAGSNQFFTSMVNNPR